MRRFSICCVVNLFLAVSFVFAQTRGGELEAVVGPNVTVGKQWAVFIAIDKYQDRGWNKLDGPVKDAKEIQAILRENYIINEWRELFDEKASAEGIRRLFAELNGQVKENDSVFVFHAGHGVKDSITEAGSWIPSDAGSNPFRKEGWISHVEIRSYLDRLPAKHVFLISDSCFSGDLLAKPRSGALPQFDNEYYRNAYSFPSRQVMSSGASQEVPDTSDFARRLKLALRRTEGACIDPLKIYEQVREANGTTPRLAALPESLRHEQDGSFLFFRKQRGGSDPSAAVGSVTVESDVAGEILIDGMPSGTIKAGGTVTINDVTTGSTEVAVRENDGTIIKVPVFILRQYETVTVVIERPVPEGLTYEIIDGKTVTITRYLGNATTVHIPGRIQGLPVTDIGNSAFSSCSSLTGITIPSSVTTIGDYAFQSCSNLTNVIIPSSVTIIGKYVFNGCGNLTSVTIPSSATTISNYAFYGCRSLENIIVDSRNPAYTSVDGVLFDKNIKTIIKYPEGKKIKTYTIPSSVTTIGNSAFSSCSNLTGISMQYYVTTIGDSAFSSCNSLTSITIPSSVTVIGDYAFYGCSSLTSVTISNGVTSIRRYAFQNCTGLTNITIPNSVTTIVPWAFDGCSSLTAINVAVQNTAYSSTDGILYNKNNTTLVKYPGGRTGTFAIPNSVTVIGENAFTYSNSLTEINIPSSVKSIEDDAFKDCSSLVSVTIPSSVTAIGNSAFSNCRNLASINVNSQNAEYTSVDGVLFDKNVKTVIKYPEGKKTEKYTIPSSVTTISNSAFSNCSSLTDITIPSSVTAISNYAFYNCSKLATVTMSRHTKVESYAFPNTTRIIYRD